MKNDRAQRKFQFPQFLVFGLIVGLAFMGMSATSARAVPPCPAVSTANINTIKNVPVTVPVTTTDVTGLGIFAVDFSFDYNPSVISYVSVTPGSVAPTAIITVNSIINSGSSATLIISAFDSTPFSGAGPLVNINFNVVGMTGNTSPLMLSNFRYNGGSVCSTLSSGTLTIVPVVTSTSVSSNLNPSIYGDNVTFTATVSSAPAATGGTVTFIIDGSPFAPCTGVPLVSGTATCSTLALNAGNHPVAANYSGTLDFTSSSGSLSGGQTVLKANATFTVTPYNVTYDGLIHTASVSTITGVNGETGATVGTVNVSNTAHTNAGTYSTDNWSFTGGPNYNNQGPTTITDIINKANATFTVTPYNVTYDGLSHTASVSTITGVNGETGAVVGTVNVSNTTHTNAGTYSTDNWSFTGGANYNNQGPTTITDIINKADATFTVTPYTVTYDGLSHTASVSTITGVNGETGATVGTVNVANTTHTNAGTYSTDNWSFTGGPNYNNQGPTTITDIINKADATFTVTPYTVTYDGLSHTASVSTITGVNGETGATVGTVNVTNTTHTNAGTYSTDNWSFTGGPNYNNQGPTTITDIINKADATFTVTPYNVTYDGLSHTASVSTITGVNGETGATVGTVNVTNTTHTNAGTYSTDNWSFTGGPNYNNQGPTTITDVINKANATVVVTPYNVNYDGMSHTAAVTSITGVNGETGATVGTVNVANTAHTNAGTYNADFWFFTGTANYNNIGNTTITDTINKANATVVVTPYNVTYDGMSHTAAITSITGVNGETGATVGTVDVSNTTHTNAGNYPADFWTFTGTANYNNIGPTTITDVIGKATATCNVTPYSVPYDNMPHTAMGQCNGVNGEMNLSTLDLSGTTHTAPGTYNDTWSFTSASGNYFDQLNVPITDTIISGSVAGAVTYSIVTKPVPGVNLDAPGAVHVTGSTDSAGNYTLINFGGGSYTITPSKPTQGCTPTNITNGIMADDASKVARYVVGLEMFTADQIQAATVNGVNLPVSSFDSALIAQKVVGICGTGGNRAGQWVFNPLSRSYMNVIGTITGENYGAIMRGDVNGSWDPTGPNRPARPESAEAIQDAIHMTVVGGRADRGVGLVVPVKIDNLRGSPVEAYQFDIVYDPRVVTPDAVAADLTGTLSANMSVAFNVAEPGLLKVAVYGAIPASGDGVYVNLRFVATGKAGSRSVLHIDNFLVNDGTASTFTYDGEIVVNGPRPGLTAADAE